MHKTRTLLTLIFVMAICGAAQAQKEFVGTYKWDHKQNIGHLQVRVEKNMFVVFIGASDPSDESLVRQGYPFDGTQYNVGGAKSWAVRQGALVKLYRQSRPESEPEVIQLRRVDEDTIVYTLLSAKDPSSEKNTRTYKRIGE